MNQKEPFAFLASRSTTLVVVVVVVVVILRCGAGGKPAVRPGAPAGVAGGVVYIRHQVLVELTE